MGWSNAWEKVALVGNLFGLYKYMSRVNRYCQSCYTSAAPGKKSIPNPTKNANKTWNTFRITSPNWASKICFCMRNEKKPVHVHSERCSFSVLRSLRSNESGSGILCSILSHPFFLLQFPVLRLPHEEKKRSHRIIFFFNW